MSQTEIQRAVEAIVFASAKPLTISEIAAYLPEEAEIETALGNIAADYEGRAIQLVCRGDRWQFQTAPDLAHFLKRDKEEVRKLSRAAVETMAIIAYHEPVTRAQIEEIRGVSINKGTIDVLMEAGWVRPAGRREVPGRPLLYATTPMFLAHFGLESRKDLPGIAELKAAGLLDPIDVSAMLAQQAAGAEGQEGDDSEDDSYIPEDGAHADDGDDIGDTDGTDDADDADDTDDAVHADTDPRPGEDIENSRDADDISDSAEDVA